MVTRPQSSKGVFEMGVAREVIAKATEAFNSHDRQRMRALYADNVVFAAPGEVQLEGPDAVVDYAMAWQRAFPDAKLTTHSILEDGESVAEEFTFEGTHEDTLVGPEGEIPATHKHLAGRGAEVFRVKDGKIVEEHLYFDQMQVLAQLGLMAEPARA
jgi:steroid delta-isomerase-like uncharacterized protein